MGGFKNRKNNRLGATSTEGDNSGKLDMVDIAMTSIPMVTDALGALYDNTKSNMTDLQKTEFNAIYGRGEDPILDLFSLGRDTRNTASQTKNTAYTNTGVLGSNQDLLNAYNSFDFDSWKPNNNKINFMQASLKNLGAIGKGASMGSEFGSKGALIGGIAGGVADLGSYIGSRKRRKIINDAKELTKDISLASWKEQLNNTNKQMNLSNYRNMKFYDTGGALDYGLLNLYALNSYVNALNKSKITSMPNSSYEPQFNSMNYFALGGRPDFNEFNTGGTHELNSNGGIPVREHSDGTIDTVEQNETMTATPNGAYVFSNRLKLSKEECKQLGVPKDSTYAEASKILRKEYDEMPNDDIAKRGWEQSRDMLIQSLEMLRQEIALKEARKQGLNSSKMQGVSDLVMQDMYYNENPQEEVLLQQGINPDIPYAFGGLVRKFEGGSFLPNTDLKKLRYAPAIGSGLSLLHNLFTREDNSLANNYRNLAKLVNTYIPNNNNYDYLIYNPVDINALLNRQAAQQAAYRNAIRNSSNPNVNSSLSAQAYNDAIASGDLVNKLSTANRDLYNSVITGNNSITQQRNADNLNIWNAVQNAEALKRNYLQLAAEAENAERAKRDNAISQSVNNFVTNLANIGNQAVEDERFNIWQAGQSMPINLAMLVARGELQALDVYNKLKAENYSKDVADNYMKYIFGSDFDFTTVQW